MRGLALIAAATALLSGAASALDPVTIKGNAFFVGNERFYIRGVDYQPGGQSKLTDPLADIKICSRDIPIFKELGLNAIRIYTVDNSKDHSECMKLLGEAGIYLILDLNTPTRSINRIDPESTYNEVYLQHVFATVDVFSKYDNTLAFFAANEVVNDPDTTPSATYVKAVTRDLKNYIKARGYRQIPVGYSAADVAENRVEMAHYLNCGTDATARGDFFAFNDYSWCGSSSFKESGWDQKVATYKDYSIPLFLSEYGCNLVMPRTFGEVESLYSSDMTPVFSGGLVYEYTMEESNYGLVEISKGEVSKLTDFENLKSAFAGAENASGDGGYQEDLKPSVCPEFVKGKWEANITLPDFPKKAETYMKNGAGNPLGLPDAGLPASEDDDDSGTTSDGSGSSDEKPKDDEGSAAAKVRGNMIWAGMGVAAAVAAFL